MAHSARVAGTLSAVIAGGRRAHALRGHRSCRPLRSILHAFCCKYVQCLCSITNVGMHVLLQHDSSSPFSTQYCIECLCADEAPTGVSLVPFAMRLLWAELPALVSPTRFFESLDRLHYIERVCSQVRSYSYETRVIDS